MDWRGEYRHGRRRLRRSPREPSLRRDRVADLHLVRIDRDLHLQDRILRQHRRDRVVTEARPDVDRLLVDGDDLAEEGAVSLGRGLHLGAADAQQAGVAGRITGLPYFREEGYPGSARQTVNRVNV
jgi:hypothetical protein